MSTPDPTGAEIRARTIPETPSVTPQDGEPATAGPVAGAAAGASPPWIREGLLASWHELRLFVSTAAAFVLHPYRSAADWSAGRLRVMNPLAFLATSAAAVQTVRALAGHALHLDQDETLVSQVLTALGPFAHYIALGLLCHLFLQATGARRRATDAVALALFAGGGPGGVAEVVGWLSALALGGARPQLILAVAASFSIFCAAFASALAALYRAGPIRIFLAFVFAFALTGLAFGLHPPGYYGMHWVLEVHFGGGGPSFGISVQG